MDETYAGGLPKCEDSDDEAQTTYDELDAFERRLRGEAPTAKPKVCQKENRPKAAAPPTNSAKTGKSYVAASKPKRMTEEQEDQLEAQRAVADLERFGH